MFAGFVPNREKARHDLFVELAGINTTLVFYETSPRLCKTLAAAADVFADREMAVVREITKIYEECRTGTAAELLAFFSAEPPKGEIVLVVAPPVVRKEEQTENLREILQKLLAEMPLKTAVAEAVKLCGSNKNETYRLALEIKNEDQK